MFLPDIFFPGYQWQESILKDKKVADHSQKLLGSWCYLHFQGLPIYTDDLNDLTTQTHQNPGIVTTWFKWPIKDEKTQISVLVKCQLSSFFKNFC